MQFESERIRRIEQNRRDYAIWDGRGSGYDPRIPVAGNIRTTSSGSAGLNTVIVSWDDCVDPAVEEYEVYVRVLANQPERVAIVPRSPARFQFVAPSGAGAAPVFVRTVLRSGIKLSLDFAPSAIFEYV